MANISIYDPRTMGKLVERMPKVQTFIKSTFFRNVETFDTQKIDVDFKKGNRQLAPFVHKKIGGVTIDNEGYEHLRATTCSTKQNYNRRRYFKAYTGRKPLRR